MSLKPVTAGVYLISLGMVNVFLIDRHGPAASGPVIIDAGIAGSEKTILAALRELGRQPGEVAGILVTHLHGDHTGGLAALQQATGAPVYMHPSEAALVRQGVSSRPAQPGPGRVNALIYRLFVAGRMDTASKIAPAAVAHEVQDGETLPLAGGIRAVYTPGHTAGHTVFLWPGQGGVLFCGDLVSNFRRVSYSMIYEDLPQAQESLRKVNSLEFDILCFSHGRPLVGGAARRMRERFS